MAALDAQRFLEQNGAVAAPGKVPQVVEKLDTAGHATLVEAESTAK